MHRTAQRSSKMLLLSEKDVRCCLSTKDCIEINRTALASLGKSFVAGKAVVPTRLALPYNNGETPGKANDWTLFKPAAFYSNKNVEKSEQVWMGMKLVSVRADNAARGKPIVPATVLLVDAPTGEVNAVLGGTYLTAARTAAGSALATELCLETSKNKAKHLVVFGAGMQAECHIDCIRCVQPSINHITIVNRSRERAELLERKLSREIIPQFQIEHVLLHDAKAVKRALSCADVVVTATNTTTPLFDGSWLKPGCHVNGIGSYTPEMQEVDEGTVNRCRVLVDTPEALNVGDLKPLKHPWELLGNFLGDEGLLEEDVKDDSIDCTFYKAVGTAIQDVMTAHMVVEKARELGIGNDVDMS